MQKQSDLNTLEVLLLILASFLAGAIGGFFLDSLRKRLVNSSYIKAQKAEADFRNDLAMEMSELR